MSLERLRVRIALEIPNNNDPFGVTKALLLGISPAQSGGGLLHLLGFIHLLHATGVHLYALAEIVFAALALILVRISAIRGEGSSAENVRPGLLLARSISISVASFGWALCGFRRSLLRPWIMVLCQSGARVLGFRWRRFSPLVLAIGIDVLVFGDATAGSLAYTIAVAGSILAVPRGDEPRRASHLRMAIGSWCLAALLEAWQDGWISFATPMLSLLTLPIYATLIYPSLLLASLLMTRGYSRLAGPIFRTVGILTRAFLVPLVKLSFSGPWIYLVTRPALLAAGIVAAASIGLGWLSRSPNSRQKWQVPALALILSLAGRPLWARTLETPGPEVSQLDVGQGDSALIQSRRYGAGLIDAGSARRVSELAWLRLMGQRRLSHFDWIAITHFDEDHVGGVATLARLIDIRCMSTSSAELESERGVRIEERLRRLGVSSVPLGSGCIPVPYLPPIALKGPKHVKNANMSAFVVPLSRGGIFLSAGDAEGKDEERIGEWMAKQETGTGRPVILKISHHGSHTSSSERFLKLVHPNEAWISVGAGNPYGHPHGIVLERLSALGIPVRRTDQEGTLMPKR